MNGEYPARVGDAVVQAVIERWIRGREKGSSRSRILKKCVQRRNTLFCYRQEALEELFSAIEHRELLVVALELLPSSACCSETEDDGPEKVRAIGLVWRSEEFSALLQLIDKLSYKQQEALHGARWAANRLDMRRQPAIQIKSSGRVPRNLPENCYCPIWRGTLTDTKRHLLTQKPPSDFLSFITSKIHAALC
ncbi:uncharacterized protein MELLADRAFT_70282 [Melampsora larici-populina 98AG31]|uniref:Uncharacterized protein n=1 Tax=Melampsora larici-populina (strain 98AG31 / pathotype 3-4-7) TaxID=747676 RepID=F4SEC2_MELLP|nr:uncharacterized protein MELLADRAFT_70282 [Melampsora larici-populina 98AG31]EGF97004.1 hypothetical protein MELLADRAFT_70282 [Melampsora larici-populina 98AG31]